MIMIQIPSQVGLGTPELLLFKMGYMVGTLALASMIYLSFRIDADYNDGIYWMIGSIAFLLFVFGVGGENFNWTTPGLVWAIGAVYLSFAFGILVGWLLPFDSDVAMRKDY